MTYKLTPEIRKIVSPVVLVFPDGNRHEYGSGETLAEAVFEERYIISSLRAVKNKVEILLTIPEMIGSGWVGEEQTSFF